VIVAEADNRSLSHFCCKIGMASFKSPDRDAEAEVAKLQLRFRSVLRQAEWRKELRQRLWWQTLWSKPRATTEPNCTTPKPEEHLPKSDELPNIGPQRMASCKVLPKDSEKQAERLKRKFRSVSRRIEWRQRLIEARWWTTVFVVASMSAFVGTALLWFAVL
jgi:hypothetical protein